MNMPHNECIKTIALITPIWRYIELFIFFLYEKIIFNQRNQPYILFIISKYKPYINVFNNLLYLSGKYLVSLSIYFLDFDFVSFLRKNVTKVGNYDIQMRANNWLSKKAHFLNTKSQRDCDKCIIHKCQKGL